MAKRVNIPGKGIFSFPDDATEDEIGDAIDAQFPELVVPAGGGDLIKSSAALAGQAYAETGAFLSELSGKAIDVTPVGGLLKLGLGEVVGEKLTKPLVDVAEAAATTHAGEAAKHLPEIDPRKPVSSTIRRTIPQAAALLAETPLFLAGAGPGAVSAKVVGKGIMKLAPTLAAKIPTVVKEAGQRAGTTGGMFAAESALRGKDAEEVGKSYLTGAAVSIAGTLGAGAKAIPGLKHIPGLKTTAEAVALLGAEKVLHGEDITAESVAEVLAILVELKVLGKVAKTGTGKIQDFGKAVEIAKQRNRVSAVEAEALNGISEQTLSEQGVKDLLKSAEKTADVYKKDIQAAIAQVSKDRGKAGAVKRKKKQAAKTVGKKQKGVIGEEVKSLDEKIFYNAKEKGDVSLVPIEQLPKAEALRDVKVSDALAKDIIAKGIREPLEVSFKEGEVPRLVEGKKRLKVLQEAGVRHVPIRMYKAGTRELVDVAKAEFTPKAIDKPRIPITEEDASILDFARMQAEGKAIRTSSLTVSMEQSILKGEALLRKGTFESFDRAVKALLELQTERRKFLEEKEVTAEDTVMIEKAMKEVDRDLLIHEMTIRSLAEKLQEELDFRVFLPEQQKIKQVERQLQVANEGTLFPFAEIDSIQLEILLRKGKDSLTKTQQAKTAIKEESNIPAMKGPLGLRPGFQSQRGTIDPKALTPETLVRGIKATQREVKAVLDALKVMKEFSGDKEGLLKEYEESVTRFGKSHALFLTLLQIGDLNPDINGFTRPTVRTPLTYIDGIKAFSNFQRHRLLSKELLLEEMQIAKPEVTKSAGKLLIDETMQGKFFTETELADYIKRNNMSNEAVRLSMKMREEFKGFLTEIESVIVSEEFRKLQNSGAEDTVIEIRLKELSEDFAQMKAKPYFPLMREGKYAVKIKNALGKTERWEQHKTKLGANFSAAKAKRDIQGKKDWAVTTHYIPDNLQPFAGFPARLIEKLVDVGQLTKKQQEVLREIQYSYSPGRSFKNRLRRRKKTPGFSEDIVRSYAKYMYHGVKHLSKIKYGEQLAEAIGEVKESQKVLEQAQVSGVKRGQLVEHLNEHMDYIMAPKNEWASLRALGFVWYLGFLPKAAFINLTQVPLVAAPHLAAEFGDVKVGQELMLHAGKDVLKAMKGRKYTPEEAKVMDRFLEDGLTNESFAATMSAVSNGSLLERVAPTTKTGRGFKYAVGKGAYLFTMAEEYNRRVTGLAAYRLAKKAGYEPEAAYQRAREAIEKTQFEYASWNRPTFMRGKVKSNLFMFYQYLQNMLYFAGRDKGNLRFMGILLAAGGLQGMPGAEDMLDVIDRMLSTKNKRYDSRKETREFIAELGANPDLLMHGTSRYGFGSSWLMRQAGIPMPDVDVSGSVSMGRIIPGGEGVLGPSEKDFNTMYAQTSRDFLGAIFSVPLAYWQATEDTGLDEIPWSLKSSPRKIKEFEKAMPSFARAASKGLTILTEGKERIGPMTFDYNKDVRYKGFEPGETTTLAGAAQVMGFPSTQIQQRKERLFMAKDTASFYRHRRVDLLDAYYQALDMKDAGIKEHVMDQIKLYNREIPYAGLKIVPEQLIKSIVGKMTKDKFLQANFGSRQEFEIYQEMLKAFPQTEGLLYEEEMN